MNDTEQKDTATVKKRKLDNDGIELIALEIPTTTKEEELFYKIFHNIVLFRNIFRQVGLYKKNECINFSSKKELKEYPERNYISKLIYNSKEMLEVRDLPTSGDLKELVFTKSELSSIKGTSIPYGVEIIYYRPSHYSRLPTAQFSTLPSTVHTINNVVLKSPIQQPPIPPNITSISFFKCPNISNNNENSNGYLIIPNTIKSLKFGNWNNEDIILRKGDLPEGLTSLKLGGYKIQPNNISEGILPNTIKELDISCIDHDDNDGRLSFNFIPPNVEILSINFNGKITPESNLKDCKSIKKLIISFSNLNIKNSIYPNSLPLSNIVELKLNNISGNIQVGTIPNSVKKLELWLTLVKDNIEEGAIPESVISLSLNKFIDKPNILPQSLTSLEIMNGTIVYSNEQLIKMISILPQSLTSITFPKEFKEFNLNLPSSLINKIDYL